MLRAEMQKESIDVFFMQSGDPHNSEFVNAHYNSIRFVSGFTGENATLIVTMQDAFLWTDGRFFIQAEKELAGSGIQLMRMGVDCVPTSIEFLEGLAGDEGYSLGFDGSSTTASTGMMLDDKLMDLGVETVEDFDLVGRIWEDRPSIKAGELFELPFEVTGMSAEEKLHRLRFAMEAADADYLLISDLMEVAWLTNLRGSDIDYTPVFFGYALIDRFAAKLFVMDGTASDEIKLSIQSAGFELRGYDDILSEIEKLRENSTIGYDPASTSYSLSMAIPEGCGLIEEETPVMLMKACKNDFEIASTKNAHVRDGLAVTKFLAWLKTGKYKEDYPGVFTALDAAEYLRKCREEQDGFFDLSFETISAYGPNGAIIHYMPTEESNLVIEGKGFLLVDSGGQYNDGTTDITRTIAMGPLSDKESEYYTRVLKSHIAMASTVFDAGTPGKLIDELARKPLRDFGLDFNHGLGHGIGHILSVHEGPNVLGRSGEQAYMHPGMIISDEPGVYIENEFGIRIENEVLVCEDVLKLRFEPITFVPYDIDAIRKERLTDDEISWINSYHEKVRETLLQGLTDEWVKSYLIEASAAL